jgi:hypothetical protein
MSTIHSKTRAIPFISANQLRNIDAANKEQSSFYFLSNITDYKKNNMKILT